MRMWVACLATIFFATAPLLAVTVDISCDRDQIYLGEAFNLSINVRGATEAGDPDLSELAAAQISARGRSPMIQQFFINGALTEQRELSIAYSIRPANAGVFKTGPIRITIGDTEQTVVGPDITVLGTVEQDDIILAVESSTNAVFIDEPFTVTFRLRMKRLAEPFSGHDPLLPNNPPHLQIPFLNDHQPAGAATPNIAAFLEGKRVSQEGVPGFTINDYKVELDPFGMGFPFGGMMGDVRPKRYLFDRREVASNGIPYFEYHFSLTYSAAKLGPLEFGPVIFKGGTITTVDAEGKANLRPVYAIAPAVTVEVISPPEQGRPASYVGLLATQLNASAQLDIQACQIGDPLILRLRLTGVRRPDMVRPPDLLAQKALWQDFKFYPDTLKTVANGDTVEFSYTIRPIRSGTIDLPAIELACFDPATRQYQLHYTAPLPVQVTDSPEVDIAAVMSSQQSTVGTRTLELNALTTAPIGAFADTLDRPVSPRSPAVWVALAVGPLLFSATRLLLWTRSSRGQRLNRRRRRNALRLALRQLATLTVDPSTSSETAGRVAELIRNYLGGMTGHPTRSMTPTDLQQWIQDRSLPDEIASPLVEIFEHMIAAQYDALLASPERMRKPLADLPAMMRRLDTWLKEQP